MDERDDPANAGLFRMVDEAASAYRLSEDLVADEVNASLPKRMAWMAFFGGFLSASGVASRSAYTGRDHFDEADRRAIHGWMFAALRQIDFDSDGGYVVSLWILETAKAGSPWHPAYDAGQSTYWALKQEQWQEAFELLRRAIDGAPPLDNFAALPGRMTRQAALLLEPWRLEDRTN